MQNPDTPDRHDVTDLPDETDEPSGLSGLSVQKPANKTFRLSSRLAVEITVGPAGLTVQWDPDMPDKLTDKELRKYRKARNETLADLSGIVGMPITIVECE